MDSKSLKLMIIEDNIGDVVLIKELLPEDKYSLDHFSDLESALQDLEKDEYDLALVDLGLPGYSGPEAPMIIMNEYPDLPIVVLTGSDNPRMIKQVFRIGAQDYLIKGKISKDILIRSIRYSIERKKVNDELIVQKAFAENIIETAHAIVLVLDTEGKIISANSFFEKLTGYEFQEIKNRSWFDIFISDKEKKQGITYFKKALVQKVHQGNINKIIKKDGGRVHIEWYYSVLKDDNNNIIGILNIGHDISKRYKAEKELIENEAFLKKSQSVGHVGSWMLEHRNRKMIWSDELYNIFSVKRSEFKPGYDTIVNMLPEEERIKFDREYKQSLNDLAPFELEHKVVTEGNTVKTVSHKCDHETDLEGKLVRTVGTVHNITDKKELEMQLLQSQKMEAIGQLAGGIAHDFNNLLMVIMFNCDLIISRTDKKDPLLDDILEIKKSGQRAASLTRQLLAFSRKQVQKTEILDVNLVISELEKMIQRLVGEKIEVNTIMDQKLGTIRSDKGQIEQILMNFVVNARDAMPSGGKLTIETENVKLDNEYTKKYSEVKPGNYVMMAVTDTGMGMSREIVDKIFEPFFTTKKMNKGTGLGLSTVYGIVKQHDGYIYCYSEPGKGTTFKVYFPIDTDEMSKEQKYEEIEDPGRGEKIVIVDDESDIRSVMKRMLTHEGYEVVMKDKPSEVLQLFKKGENFDLLITDVVMPDMNGDELAEEILKINPDTKIVFMSGYTESTIMDFSTLDKNKIYVQKPFTRQFLVKTIRDMLTE